MARCVLPRILGLAALFGLAGCGLSERAERPAWRAQAENLCLAQGDVRPSPYVVAMPPISGPTICGLEHPFKVSGLKDGAVAVSKAAVLDCSMIAALDVWLDKSVQPAAQARFGVPITELQVFGGYSCRSVDNIPGAKLSEHSFANAVDVSGFRLADGRDIVIVRDWKKEGTQEAAFLRDVEGAACDDFTTVLAPGSDVYHYNHFHLDLAAHGRTNTGPRRYCRPLPQAHPSPLPPKTDGLPPAPDVEEPQDVARRDGAGVTALAAPSIGLPPAYGDPPPPVLPAEDPQPAIDVNPTSKIKRAHIGD